MSAIKSREQDLFVTSAQSAEVRLRRFLAENCRYRVELIITRNRVSMASLKFIDNSRVRLRLHEQFLQAPSDVWEALARYIRTRRRSAWDLVSEYAVGIDAAVEPAVAEKPKLRYKGAVYDLRAIARKVNQEFFQGRIKYEIGWGNARPARRHGSRSGKSIRYGSWTQSTGVIRIHPLLDDKRVPRRFVEYVVFHEMLHAVVPGEFCAGKRLYHTSNFRAFEKAFPDLDDMYQLAEKLLHVLC